MYRGSVGISGRGAHVIQAAIDGVSALLIGVECGVGLGKQGTLRDANGQAIAKETRVFEIQWTDLLHQDAVGFAIRSTDATATGARFGARGNFTGCGCLFRVI
jgi:hypothetical protein